MHTRTYIHIRYMYIYVFILFYYRGRETHIMHTTVTYNIKHTTPDIMEVYERRRQMTTLQTFFAYCKNK